MPDTPLTPEEKLLRIIETPQSTLRQRRPAYSFQDFGFFFKIFKERHWKNIKEKAQACFNLKSINIFLVVLSAAATLYLVLDLAIQAPRPRMLAQIEKSAKSLDVGDLAIEGLAPLSIFMQEITQRNIFSLPPPAAQKPDKPATPEAPKTTFTDTLKLVGIIWSEAPQAMVEDSKSGRTYLVNRGGKINEARVKDILKDRVVLSYDNQEIEIR